MYARIKELADSAVALQNKLNMEAALREISGICSIELDDAWIDKSLASAGTSAFEDAKALPPLEVVREFVNNEGAVVSVLERPKVAGKAKKAAKK